MSTQQNISHNDLDDESINIKETLFKYLNYWPIFLLSVIAAILIVFLYLRYANDIYDSSGKIKILKENEGLDFTALQGSSPLLDLSEVNLENEKEILKSRKLISNVINKLNLQTRFKREGQIKSFTLFDKIPVSVDWEISDTAKIEEPVLFYLSIIDNSSYRIEIDELDYNEKHKFGNSVNIGEYNFTLNLKKELPTDAFENQYSFQYIKLDKLISDLSQSINVQSVGETSEILQISLEGENQRRNEAIINSLIEEFKQDGVRDNRKIAKRTKDFVEERLGILMEELDSVEQSLVKYKRSNDIVDVKINAEVLFEKSSKAELEYFEKSKQLSIAQLFKNEIENTDKFELLPVNLGIQSENVNTLTDEYNKKLLERQKLLVSSTTKNAQIIEINTQIKDIKRNILKSLDNYINSLKSAIQEINQQVNKFDNQISSLPKKEKNIRKIGREQSVKEKLYLFLLQKQLEAGLSYAIASPKAKVVDYAYTKPEPVSPKKPIILLGGLIIGLAIPFGFLYLKFLLYTKINSKSQIENVIKDSPIVAEIPLIETKINKLIDKYDVSPLAEAFRILRTNLGFLKGKLNKNKASVVYVTSSTKGEGKTFISANLASVFAATKKKTLLIGTDLRNPQLHNVFKLDKNAKGLTNFLSDDDYNFDDLIYKNVSNNNVDVILSGPIPPNPSELLDNPRFEEIISEAKSKYDYVIVDTAPTIHVSDTLLITHLSDVLLYIVRAEFTDIKLLEHIKKLKDFNKIDNMGLIINGLSSKGKYSYNYGYGYGYAAAKEKKKGLKFWVK